MEETTFNQDAMSQGVTVAAIVNEFLSRNYQFRLNQLSGKLEFLPEASGKAERRENGFPDFRELDERALNSMLNSSRIALPDVAISKTLLNELINREETPIWNPIRDYLNGLPKWDGHNRVAELFGRIPNVTSEQIYRLNIWLRSAVAHFLQLDTLHGNELIPTLIGPQGCGKTTFCKLLVPPHLRQYVLDHINFGNKFDKDMALTNNMFVIIDEIDRMTPNQYAELKYTLSRNRVNGRQIFGRVQTDKPRYASFLATTNKAQPLCDPTGSRRFICISIETGKEIDNSLPIDYNQLYAQIVDEVVNQKLRYWLTTPEEKQLETDNLQFQRLPDLTEMIDSCFTMPADDEHFHSLMDMNQIIEVINRRYPQVKNDTSTKTRIGIKLTKIGFKKERSNTGFSYYIIPREAA